MWEIVLAAIVSIPLSMWFGHRVELSRGKPHKKGSAPPREEERPFVVPNLATQAPARRKTDTSPHPAALESFPVVDMPTIARLYVSNQDQLCMWGKKPRHVPSTWLAYDHPSGLYGLSPYAVEDALAALKKESVEVEVTPQAANRGKRLRIIKEATERVLASKNALLPDMELHGGEKLFDYQRVALAYADATQGRFLLADDMGLGKTLEALACAKHLDCERVVIVTRATVKPKWAWEIKKFFGERSIVIDGSSSEPIPSNAKYVILNYEVADEWLADILEWKPDMCIIDEVHWISNPKAKRSAAVKRMGQSSPYCIGLSGTPMRNRPKDLWNILDTIQPGWWGREFEYQRAFCMGRKRPITRYVKGKRITNLVWVADGISHEDVFHERMKVVMLRRTKSEVDLPPRSRAIVPVALVDSMWQKYRGLQARLAQAFQKHQYQEILKIIGELRETSSLGRVDATIDKALEITKIQERPVVVFAYFLNALDAIESALKKEGLRVGRIDGSVSQETRAKVQRDFQDGHLDVFLGQINAAGEGIDLFRADTTLHHDVTWTPFEQDQAESRVHRKGQQNPTLHLYFVGQGTIDERILDLTIKKLQMSLSIIDTGEKLDKDLLRELKEEHFNVKVEA